VAPQQRQASTHHHVEGAVFLLGRLGGAVVQHQVIQAQEGREVTCRQVQSPQVGEPGRPADITAQQVHFFNMADYITGNRQPGEARPGQVKRGQDHAWGFDASVEQGEVVEKD
jgi:hypothetical protein